MTRDTIIDFLVKKYYIKLENSAEQKRIYEKNQDPDYLRFSKNWKYEADVIRELLAQIVMLELEEQGIAVHNHFTLVFENGGMSFKNEPITKGELNE